MTTKLQTAPRGTVIQFDAEKVDALDAVANDYTAALAGTDNRKFKAAFVTASAMQQLRDLITPDMMGAINQLMNTRLGFLTDKNPNKGGPEPYKENIVKDVCVEMALRGLPFIGNCFNIIAGNGYVTKEGFTLLLKRLVTDLRLELGVPKMLNGGAIVPFSAAWKVGSVAQEMTGDVPVKVNSGMGVDAILGKADRKVKARIHARVTGTELTDGDVDFESMPRAEVNNADAASMTQRLADAAATKAAPVEQASGPAPVDTSLQDMMTDKADGERAPAAEAKTEGDKPPVDKTVDLTAGIPDEPALGSAVLCDRDGTGVEVLGDVVESYKETFRVKLRDGGKVKTVPRVLGGKQTWRYDKPTDAKKTDGKLF